MTNMAIATTYLSFALVTAIIIAVEVRRRFKRREDYLYVVLCLSVALWYVVNIVGILTGSEALAKYCVTFILIFVSCIPPLLLLFVLRFYKVAYWPSKAVLLLLFAIPCINAAMVLTSPFHPLVARELTIGALAPVRELTLVWGSWFWVHTIYSYLVSLVLIGVILFRHFRMPRFYRLPSTMMVAGVALTLFGNLLYLLRIFPATFDPTLVTTSLSLILFNLAIINNNKSKFVRLSHGQIYHYLNEYILILDESGQIVDANRPALTWFAARDIDLLRCPFDDVLGALTKNGRRIDTDLNNERVTDIYCNSGAFPVVLNLKTHEITDRKGDTFGSIAVLVDVTQNRMLIERLEAKAGMDPLTGLANRMAYEGARKRLDDETHYPLSVIVLDVNNLKQVNDQLGHQYGDMMLQEVAKALEDACPPSGLVTRIGGDEFVFLLPNTEEESAARLVKEIKRKLSDRRDLPFSLSAAMGFATKHSGKEALEAIIVQADNMMYEDKKRTKAKPQKSVEKGEKSDGWQRSVYSQPEVT